MGTEPYTCDLDPETSTTLKIYLFKNVQNVEEIRSNILKGVWRCAVIKPRLVLDPLQVAVAANRAALALKQDTMCTRSVYSEILFNLSLSSNISQSLSKFGIEKEQELLVCFLVTPESDPSVDTVLHIAGELCPLSELYTFTREQEVKQVYKLTNYQCSDRCGLLDVVISRIVTKNFVSHQEVK